MKDYEKDLEVIQKSEFLSQLHNRNKRKQNFQMVILGETGSGKSCAGLRIAYLYGIKTGNPFTVEDVVFTAKEFLQRIENLPEYSFILFDEAGIQYSSSDWFDDLVKILSYTLQSFRYKLINILFSVPNKQMLAKVGRNLLHCQGTMTGHRKMKIYKILL